MEPEMGKGGAAIGLKSGLEGAGAGATGGAGTGYAARRSIEA